MALCGACITAQHYNALIAAHAPLFLTTTHDWWLYPPSALADSVLPVAAASTAAVAAPAQTEASSGDAPAKELKTAPPAATTSTETTAYADPAAFLAAAAASSTLHPSFGHFSMSLSTITLLIVSILTVTL